MAVASAGPYANHFHLAQTDNHASTSSLSFLRPVFSASRLQQVSDLRLKFALRAHHVWKYGRHPICDGEIR